MENELVVVLGRDGADVVVFRMDSMEKDGCLTCRTGSMGA